jgi:hypothetical protein
MEALAMLSDDLRKLFENPAEILPTETSAAALAALIRLAQEVEADHEEARVYHDEIGQLHREADDAARAARRAWDSMIERHSPDEHRMAAERLASFRTEISEITRQIIRYRRLHVASLERVRNTCRQIRTQSIEYGLMTPPEFPAVASPETAPEPPEGHRPPLPTGDDPPAVAGAQAGLALPRIDGDRCGPRDRRAGIHDPTGAKIPSQVTTARAS